jgi:hypothetical protein
MEYNRFFTIDKNVISTSILFAHDDMRVKSYNFHIKFTSIRVQTKKMKKF